MLVIIGMVLSIYFSYHLIVGHRGYFSLKQTQNQIIELEQALDIAQIEREQLETKVKMMRPGSIDRDLLEEQARHILGYQHANEIVISTDR